ncbi:L,D-transpeptidase family protein [Sphingomonas sp. LY54]|uniref:L,D-transpeptidase family protein n=1 Tax=Sphingomonas sp. LY54 TaxID=3095343 RepID=UPI002D77831C|nr:L,D-transpeptidase family protein [Sphingomonas sp. LY54]WRP29368.1 L,D-transpeptidase family protein [Sphingomonas sp. LY54]
MTKKMEKRAGRIGPARASILALCLAASLPALLPAEAHAQAAPWAESDAAIEAALRSAGGSRDIRAFYKARDYRPLWIRGGTLGPAADSLLGLIASAEADGLDPDDYRPRALAEAIDDARGGSAKDLAKAEMLLSRSFASYVRDVRRPRESGMDFVDKELVPATPTIAAVLEEAAAAASLESYVANSGWMHPIYGQLRKAATAHVSARGDDDIVVPGGPGLRRGAADERVTMLRYRLGLDPRGPFDASVEQAVRDFQAAHGLPQDGIVGSRTLAALNGGSPDSERILRVNLERARALPARPPRRYVLVDAAAARLWLYEDGKVRDTMRVVVGKPSEPTPMMAGVIRYAMVNPYWNLPPDLARKRVAAGVLKDGVGFLKTKGFEVLSDWSDNAVVVDPSTVDWQAAAAGRIELRARQLPGPANAMGKMKFMFPNDYGVYLHDTPEKDLLRKTDRRFSSGCVRVEDAPRLARWLFGKPLKVRAGDPEQRVDLSEPVPVYITYLTAAPDGDRIAFRPDVYNRDGVQLAAASRSAARR